MCRRATFVRLLVRTPSHLWKAGCPTVRNVHSASSSSGSRAQQTQASTTAAPAPSRASLRPSHSSQKNEATGAAVTAGAEVAASVGPLSPSSAPSSSPPPTPFSSLVKTVEQLKEVTRRTQHTLRSQEDALQLLQQKFGLMERQMGQLESAAEGLHRKLNEVHRVVGEIIMGQRNTDLLIQQMEREQLTRRNSTMGAATQARQGDSSTHSEGVDTTASTTSATSTSGSSPASSTNTQSSIPSDPSLSHQVAMLEARVNQLTLELFGADRLNASSGLNDPQASQLAVENMATVLSSPDASAKRVALMRALHCKHLVSAFTDAAGVTRVTSQCVRVHNIPLNMGAAEVRELCVHHVCEGDSSGFVSCTVRRTPDAMRCSASSSALKAASAPSTEGSAGASPVYASQQKPKAAPLLNAKGGPLSRTSGAFPVAKVAAATNPDALPRGDAVAAIQPNTKSFEVVFASSALAVRALKVLNGLQLRPTMHTASILLAVEPVASADVLSALREVEAAGAGAVKK
ncbi:hypothetical protein ABL78_4329 [Leptomonas seymouri]|uniref:Uncharacterized protein n=1 Tax=Leptomonas seymouri TaxID=5684 RepID=A0A0N1IKU0_LEPSE|nr:hypothetical protein ABL78_4329 [Leptomonas seymouri]|eukprot:KPI86600.1 hypothetical protein ABL78_4329 [Leptomonas seymouri]